MIDRMLERYDLLLTVEVRAFWVIVALYALCLLLHLTHVLAHPLYYSKEKEAKGALFFGQAATTLLFLTVILQACLLIFRSYERGGCPIQTRYEAYQLFAWMSTMTYLFVRRRWEHIYMPGVIVNAVALGALLLAVGASSANPDPSPLGPIWKSPWYVWHLGATFLAYGVLTVSFAIELSYVGARILHGLRFFPEENQMLLEHPVFHADAHRLALFAFPLLTFGILTGVAWTAQTLGQMWSWDALSTASPLCWLILAVYLHAMRMPRWNGALASAFNILAFISVIGVFAGSKMILTLLGFGSLDIAG